MPEIVQHIETEGNHIISSDIGVDINIVKLLREL